jgi:hypothetical protein
VIAFFESLGIESVPYRAVQHFVIFREWCRRDRFSFTWKNESEERAQVEFRFLREGKVRQTASRGTFSEFWVTHFCSCPSKCRDCEH